PFASINLVRDPTVTFIDFLLDRFAANADSQALVWNDETCSYGWLLERIGEWSQKLQAAGVVPGTVTALESDFSPNSVALFLALAGRGCTLVPLAPAVGPRRDEFLAIAQAEVSLRLDAEDDVAIVRLSGVADHPLYQHLRTLRHPGLVLFSSG